MILSKCGELYSIGNNVKGQLGLGDKHLEFSTAPLLVQEFKN
jgi:alpha-tubulin suppressor-like RCC1 family protein